MTTLTLAFGTAAKTAEGAAATAKAARTPFVPSSFVAGLRYTRNEFLIMLIIGVVFFGVFTLVSSPFAEQFCRHRMLGVVTIGIVVIGFLFLSPPRRRNRGSHGLAHPRLLPHVSHLRADWRSVARAIHDVRAIFRLGHQL